MALTIKDIFKKVDELDTFLIEAGFERNNELEIISLFKNASHEDTRVTITITEPNHMRGSYEED